MILNVYKEKNWTSFDVVAKIRGILRSVREDGKKVKVGHAGTLDPLAYGVLIVLTDGDTKKQDDFLNKDKTYVAEISFGAESETYDLEAELKFNKIPKDLDIKTKLKGLLPKYTGSIDQQVPKYSAVKVSGERLYKQARKNKPISKLPVKKVKINEIKLLDYYIKNDLPTVTLEINCSKGTYIRSLAHDLGNDLGIGGVLIALLRTKVGDYILEDSRSITEIQQELKS